VQSSLLVPQVIHYLSFNSLFTLPLGSFGFATPMTAVRNSGLLNVHLALPGVVTPSGAELTDFP